MESTQININNSSAFSNRMKTISLVMGGMGLLILLLHFVGFILPNSEMVITVSLLLMGIGIVLYSRELYLGKPQGIKNNGVWFKSVSNRGIIGIILGVVLTGFYILLYWYPEYLGQGKDGAANSGLIGLFDPISQFLKGQPASQWFVYGVLYTLAILGFGYKFILKYKHNKYEQLRTISVMFFQLIFAFLLPEMLMRLNMPYNNFANMWPLNYYFFEDWHIKELLHAGNMGMFMFIFGLLMIFIISPILTYKYGKRWYCSWVCGCGGLAETAGDSFRHLSSKKLITWKIERWMIHTILVFAFIMTVAVISTFLSNNPALSVITKGQFLIGIIVFLIILGVTIFYYKRNELNKDAKLGLVAVLTTIIILIGLHFSLGVNLFIIDESSLKSWYGFAIGAMFSGVIGVGFYPLLGNRVWCRFGCPMAGILGIQQRLFSKFRITTNGGQCISCGNCSTYCEMGIDVRSYAQKGQNIVRASCVGCGVCAAVCPRGVLKLENGKIDIDMRA